jgi:FkbM family methyltransferase
MSRIRYLLTQATLRGLAWFSGNEATPVDNDLYYTRIFSGPLRGMSFSMPRLERAAYALGTYERHVVDTIAAYVKTNAVAYDVGANAGYLTLVLAKLVGPQGKVFAFEPDPKNFKALESNLERNAMAQVTAVAKAVSSESGTVTFASYEYSLVGHIAGENTPGDAKLHQVAAISLDDFIFVENQPQPSFIKIDVEGAEEQVLRGATRVLQEVRPVILAEVRSGTTWQVVSELMKQYNYDPQHLSGGWEMGKDYLGDVLFVPVGKVG